MVEFQHVKPGKGGAFVRTKLKNVRTGAVLERTFRADERVEQAIVQKREMQYLYNDGEDYVFMDNDLLRPASRDARDVGGDREFLKEGDSAVLQLYESEIVGVELPAAVELKVTQTEPGVQGDRVSGARSPQPWRRDWSCRYPCSSTPASASRWTPARVEYITRA